jgi:hypothetical protein
MDSFSIMSFFTKASDIIFEPPTKFREDLAMGPQTVKEDYLVMRKVIRLALRIGRHDARAALPSG